MPIDLQNTKTLNKIFLCFETKHKNTKFKPRFSYAFQQTKHKNQNSNLKSMNKTPYLKPQIATQPQIQQSTPPPTPNPKLPNPPPDPG